MDMTLRWFGEGVDSVSLEQIRQIPGVKGVITTLYDIPAGEAWPMERIQQMKAYVEERGLKVLGIESVNIHDAIKVGIPERGKVHRKLYHHPGAAGTGGHSCGVLQFYAGV